MIVHAFNHSTLEAKAGRFHEFEFSLVYRVGYTEKSVLSVPLQEYC